MINSPEWKSHFDTEAVAQIGVLTGLLRTLSWQDLVPDQNHAFLTGGLGTYRDTGDVLESDLATAAFAPGGTLGVVYVPTPRTITLDTSQLRGKVRARWFDPSDGSYQPASAPFTTPGRNAEGDGDWVLVVESH
jgi:hypothetical protein